MSSEGEVVHSRSIVVGIGGRGLQRSPAADL
jgi:hypothetical protein